MGGAHPANGDREGKRRKKFVSIRNCDINSIDFILLPYSSGDSLLSCLFRSSPLCDCHSFVFNAAPLFIGLLAFKCSKDESIAKSDRKQYIDKHTHTVTHCSSLRLGDAEQWKWNGTNGDGVIFWAKTDKMLKPYAQFNCSYGTWMSVCACSCAHIANMRLTLNTHVAK